MDLDLSNLRGFDWNKANLDHIKKHGVGYKECEDVFLNKPLVLNRDETHSQAEERFRTYGQTNSKRLLFIIFTIRSNKIRVISARNQNKKEREEINKKKGGEYNL